MKRSVLFLLLTCLLLSASAQIPDKSWWTFSYPANRAPDSGLLSLRYLNEPLAGKNGFIRLSKDGNSFVNGKGLEIRFWASNGGSLASEFTDKQLDTLARFLASKGVNLVRYHGAINPRGKNTGINDADTKEITNIWRCVAAMKKHGIYTVISPFWPHNGHMGGWVPEEWGIEGYSGKDDLWAVMYFNDKLRQGYKSWVKQLYTTPNPYTGVALKDEPAVAIIQIENEDAVFFWTMGSIKPALAKMAGQQFSEWLKAKYGSLAAVKQRWGTASHKDDDFASGIIGLNHIYELTIPASPGVSERLKDQTEFYAHIQRTFYDDMAKYYREELGCKQIINGNNWRTASQSRLLDLERWTNSGVDVIAANKYFDPQHKGPNDGWRIEPGDHYGAPSALKNPADLPSNLKHVTGRPMMITESAWNLPNKYQTEGPLLMAAYGGLTGLDAFFWFCPTATTFATQLHFTWTKINGQHPMNRWSTSTPGETGMFPANALIHRLGYVKEGKAVAEQRSMNSMLDREVPSIFEEQSFDPNRDFIIGNKNNEGKSTLSPLTFLTGNVSTTYGSDKDTVAIYADQSKLIDTERSLIASVTAQHRLDYKNGIFILNTPKAKAVAGFLNTQKVFELGEVIISSDNEYATIELVSMDDKNISQSKKMLLQVGTIFRPTNWNEEPSAYSHNNKEVKGFKITNTGILPWLGMPAQGSVKIKNKHIDKAIQLDAAGYRVKDLNLKVTGDTVELILPADAYYILLE
ncbi:beta-galactosidase [Pedobacter psychroterrae]|uniref:Glycoside hydrolase family 42 N-terminal domain-containing protein n=1 Tax=Pedobacter psychroterrae TaxID=2530453 RepID=A0A4R0NES6_9SPHI|nr:beta-galactosidase [Pedobacter psychroterrae]TCC98969.1 hypothetical protein EZ437_17695 [Pedobacter psychroterrae]